MPALDGLWQQGVVGVGARVGGDVPSGVPAEALQVHEDAHELGDGERGVGVVELDGDLVMFSLNKRIYVFYLISFIII